MKLRQSLIRIVFSSLLGIAGYIYIIFNTTPNYRLWAQQKCFDLLTADGLHTIQLLVFKSVPYFCARISNTKRDDCINCNRYPIIYTYQRFWKQQQEAKQNRERPDAWIHAPPLICYSLFFIYAPYVRKMPVRIWCIGCIYLLFLAACLMCTGTTSTSTTYGTTGRALSVPIVLVKCTTVHYYVVP